MSFCHYLNLHLQGRVTMGPIPEIKGTQGSLRKDREDMSPKEAKEVSQEKEAKEEIKRQAKIIDTQKREAAKKKQAGGTSGTESGGYRGMGGM